MKCLKIIGLLAGLALLHGCAAIPEAHELAYEPQPDVSAVEGASEVTVNVVVDDAREDQRRISNKRHNFGFGMASIYSEEPLEVSVQAAIEQELLARGFVLESDAPLTIKGDILELYSNLHFGWFSGKAVADSTVQVEVVSEVDEVLFSKEISVSPEHTGLQYQSASNLARPVELAIEETLDELFDDPLFMEALLSDSHISGIR